MSAHPTAENEEERGLEYGRTEEGRTEESKLKETTSPSSLFPKKTEYLVHTTVRTMLGNPSALYHGKLVVIKSDIRQQLMLGRQRWKEERDRRAEERKRKKMERRRQWEEQQKRKKQEQEAQHKTKLAPPVTEVLGSEQLVVLPPNQGFVKVEWEEGAVIPEAIYCNSCGALSYGSRIEYEYSVSTHLTAVFTCLCCYCWIPYLLRCCMDEVYYCHICGAFLGKTSTLSRRTIC